MKVCEWEQDLLDRYRKKQGSSLAKVASFQRKQITVFHCLDYIKKKFITESHKSARKKPSHGDKWDGFRTLLSLQI